MTVEASSLPGHLTLDQTEARALHHASRATTAKFFVVRPPPKYVIGTPNAAAAENSESIPA